jgi:hypothetical protein
MGRVGSRGRRGLLDGLELGEANLVELHADLESGGSKRFSHLLRVVT